MHFLDNSVAVMFLSFIFGMIGNAVLRKLAIYENISNRLLFSSLKTYERLGIHWYKKLLLATPLRFFNSNICFTSDRSPEALKSIRDHMANAEVAHWVAFFAMLIVNIVAWWFRGSNIGASYLLLNLLGNLYPCLLQQYNRHRLAKLFIAAEKRRGTT